MTTYEIYRGPDGRHWAHRPGDDRLDETEGWLYRWVLAMQDPITGRWAPAPGGPEIEVGVRWMDAGYVQVSADPHADPTLARLHELVNRLLGDFHQQTGTPWPSEPAVRAALEDAAWLPELEREIGHGRARAAASTAASRARRRPRG